MSERKSQGWERGVGDESLWIIPFGKHAGPVEDAPTSYLEWLTEQEWFCEKFVEGMEMIGKELAFRTRFGREKEDEDRLWNRRMRK